MGRPAFLATVAGQVTPQLCELDDREQFRAGIDLILADSTTPSDRPLALPSVLLAQPGR
jgi:hypothetical protein